MVVWRISRHRDLKGSGGLRAAGRWHYAGHPVVYLSENPASALLEICVHTAANDVPPDFTLLRIEGPDLKLPVVMESDLPDNWRKLLGATRTLGTDWLRKKGAVLLRLPSAIVPQTTNFLFNPLHPDASRFRIAAAFTYPFDERVKQ
jgi:RES domain-containing protein